MAHRKCPRCNATVEPLTIHMLVAIAKGKEHCPAQCPACGYFVKVPVPTPRMPAHVARALQPARG